jgi:hypothetical protein
MLVFALTIGRCMFLGIFSSSMKQSLYQSGLKLKEAYKRIEELAELDELTGSYNRRCIMRMLDEEIARTGRSGSPCSIALIDLDWSSASTTALATRPATRCCERSPSPCSPTSAASTISADMAARNSCWCCPT